MLLDEMTAEDRAYITLLVTSQNYAWLTLIDLLEAGEKVTRLGIAERLREVLGLLQTHTRSAVPEDIRPDFIAIRALIDMLVPTLEQTPSVRN